jgi:TRAP-type transport system periplasmic protein
MAATTSVIRSALRATLVTALMGCSAEASAQTVGLRYGHSNPPASSAGIQAQMLADAIAKNTSGKIKVAVYPSSQLGKLQELTEAVSTATIALSHNTAGGIGSLHEPFAAGFRSR